VSETKKELDPLTAIAEEAFRSEIKKFGIAGFVNLPAAKTAPLITRIEAVVDAAIVSGATQEVALMSWLHQHLTAAHSLLAGAETFHVSEAGKAVLAEIRGFK
jgi:hypothetical protein